MTPVTVELLTSKNPLPFSGTDVSNMENMVSRRILKSSSFSFFKELLKMISVFDSLIVS